VDQRRYLMRIWLDVEDATSGPWQPAWYDFRYGNIGLTAADVAAGKARGIPGPPAEVQAEFKHHYGNQTAAG
jgi:hypothetical protein